MQPTNYPSHLFENGFYQYLLLRPLHGRPLPFSYFMLFGYARVSTAPADRQDQNLSLQLNVLEKAGCQKIFQDRGGGPQSISCQRATPITKATGDSS